MLVLRVWPWLVLIFFQRAVAGVRSGVAGDDFEEHQPEGQARKGDT